MTPYVEQLRLSEKRIHLIERSFQIFRILLSNDQADRGGLPSILAQGSGVLLRVSMLFPISFLDRFEHVARGNQKVSFVLAAHCVLRSPAGIAC
jgi:hypothetical protein